jgi:hypothetical protein
MRVGTDALPASDARVPNSSVPIDHRGRKLQSDNSILGQRQLYEIGNFFSIVRSGLASHFHARMKNHRVFWRRMRMEKLI